MEDAGNATATAAAVAGLTPEEQIGQAFMVGFFGTEPSPEIVEMIERHHVGGVILFSRNLRGPAQALELTARLREIARAAGHPAPLLIATDQENGLVRRLGPGSTIFPGAMALGAADDERLTFEVAEATGRELRALGITMNLAPVADVNNNPANPVIGVRSFGEDPELVARHVAAAVRGHRAAGVIATLKHFPGHGDTAADSHRALPVVPSDDERLERVELVPFRRGIAAGADCVMTGHIALPRLTGSAALPATLAPQVVGGLLRDRLGFDGVVITDCLEMRAIKDGVGVARGAVMALAAGADVVLISHHATRQMAGIEAVRRAVAEGALPADTLRRAAGRVLALKRRALAWDGPPDAAGLAVVGGMRHRALRDGAYARSATLARDAAGLIPLRLAPSERLLVLGPARAAVSAAVDIPYAHESLAEHIRRRHANTTARTIAPTPTPREMDEVRGDVAAADLTLLVTLNARLDPGQADAVRALLPAGGRIIGLAACDPYDVSLFPDVPAYLATYEYSEPALAAAVAVLFGEAKSRGRLPITVPDRTHA